MDLQNVVYDACVPARQRREEVVERRGGHEQLLEVRTREQKDVFLLLFLHLSRAGLQKRGEFIRNDFVHAVQESLILLDVVRAVLVRGLDEREGKRSLRAN